MEVFSILGFDVPVALVVAAGGLTMFLFLIKLANREAKKVGLNEYE